MIDRFREMLMSLNLTAAEFADKIGVQRSSISHILGGRNKPSLDFIEKIISTFPQVDIVWLISGKRSTDVQGKPENLAEPGFTIAESRQPDLFSAQETSVPDTMKTPDQEMPGPVDHIIIVYRNNTFRLLREARKGN